MENKNEFQELNLDELLTELHDIVEEDLPEVEPDEELQELLDLPEISVTPVVIRETEIPELVPEEAGEDAAEEDTDPALEGATVMFTPLPTSAPEDSEAALTEDTTEIPEDIVLEGDTIALPVDQVVADSADAEDPKAASWRQA